MSHERIFYASKFNSYSLNIIPLLGLLIKKWPLCLTFVKEKLRPEILPILMCTVLLHDRGQ